MTVHLSAAGDVFDGVLFCDFSQDMSVMRSWTELRQILKIYLPTLTPVSWDIIYSSSLIIEKIIC